MIKIIRVIDNETIEIARYRNPRIVFNNNYYDDIDNYCDLKVIINPFTLYGENEQLKSQLQQKENIVKEIKAQLEYLETYSSKEDVFEDMKRRLDRIKKIIGENNE